MAEVAFITSDGTKCIVRAEHVAAIKGLNAALPHAQCEILIGTKIIPVIETVDVVADKLGFITSKPEVDPIP